MPPRRSWASWAPCRGRVLVSSVCISDRLRLFQGRIPSPEGARAIMFSYAEIVHSSALSLAFTGFQWRIQKGRWSGELPLQLGFANAFNTSWKTAELPTRRIRNVCQRLGLSLKKTSHRLSANVHNFTFE